MTLRGHGHRNLKVGVAVLAVAGLVFVGCAKRKTTTISSCDDAFRELMAKGEEEYCSPILYNHFESQVTEWRGECGTSMIVEKNKVAKKLQSAQSCSETSRRADMLTANCEFRLNKQTQTLSCIGESECAAVKEEMDKITAECDVPLLKGKLTEQIAQANRYLDERIHNGNRLKSLQNLMILCDEVYEIRSTKQARSRLNQILKNVKKTKDINTVQKAGSLLEQFQNGAIESCDFALTEVMKKLTDVSDKAFEKISSTTKRKKRHIKRYKKYGARLMAVNAQALFPDALAPLKDLLVRFGSDLDIPAPQPQVAPKPTKQPKKSKESDTAIADKESPAEPDKKVPDPEEEKKKAEAANTPSETPSPNSKRSSTPV